MFHNERTRSTPLDPKHIFRGVSDRFMTAQKSMQNRPNWYEYRTSSLNNVASEFFATNALNPLHLSQNSCFRCISDRFVTARKLMHDEDIATNDTSTPTPVSTSTTPLGPIAHARARRLIHQVSSLLSSGSSYLENGDTCTLVLLRNHGLDQK
jgi:hypothetical protein